ncbi:MAG: hypothetical protein IJL26_09455 [Clostridia bacterium]|nr:hypothetical protein [Clostridia bacterium]
MKKITFRMILSFLLIGSLLSACPVAGAADAKRDMRTLRIVSDMGAHGEFPENSAEAVLLAAEQGADEVRLPVKATADGLLILSEDDNLERICGTDNKPIAALKSDEVRALRVRGGSGGAAEFTESGVPLLTDVLTAANGKIRFLLDFDFSIRDAVYAAAKDAGALADCDFTLRAPAEKALAWLDALDENVSCLIYRKTNVIFTAFSILKAVGGDGGVWFASGNPYGVVWSKAVGSRLTGCGCAAARVSRKTLCGKRFDTPDYWDNLIAAGYNMLITDDAAAMVRYREESLAALALLREHTAKVESSFRLEELRSPAYRKMKFAYNNALAEARRLCAKDFAGRTECEDALYALRTAVNDIESNHEQLLNGEADLRLTPGRIVTAALTVAVFAALEIFIAKKRRKTK